MNLGIDVFSSGYVRAIQDGIANGEKYVYECSVSERFKPKTDATQVTTYILQSHDNLDIITSEDKTQREVQKTLMFINTYPGGITDCISEFAVVTREPGTHTVITEDAFVVNDSVHPAKCGHIIVRRKQPLANDIKKIQSKSKLLLERVIWRGFTTEYILQDQPTSVNNQYRSAMIKLFRESSAKLDVISVLNDVLQRERPGFSVKSLTKNPRTLSRLHIINGTFVPTEHLVSKKTDGYTTLVLLCGGKIRAICDSLDDPIVDQVVTITSTNVIEGEFVEGSIVCYDLLTALGTYEERLEQLSKLVKSLTKQDLAVSFVTKKILRASSPEALTEVLGEESKFDSDGLIFTPNSARDAPIYKWKPAD